MTALSPVWRIGLFFVFWFAWVTPFAFRRMARGGSAGEDSAVKIDPRARWGILLSMAGFFAAGVHGPRVWASGLDVWRAMAGSVFALFSIALAWSAVTALGRHWRVDAGLTEDHELVQTGAYRLVRHPIYASMLGMLMAAICLVGTLPGWPVAIVLFVAGMEVRVHVEDGLLRERFGERFVAWQRSTPAYLPFVR